MANDETGQVNMTEKVQLANRLFRQYYAQCFWYLRRDLEVTEESLPLILHGLRTHGGHRGFRWADLLCR